MHRRNHAGPVRRSAIVLVVVIALVTAACGDDGDVDLADQDTASPSPTPTSTTSPTPTPTPTPTSTSSSTDDEPAFEGDTEDVSLEGDPDQETAVLSEVAVAVHDDFDRVVFEFSTGDRPRVLVEYEPDPREPGSGQPVDVEGDTTLWVGAEAATDVGADLYAPGHDPYDGPDRVDGGEARVVTEVVSLGDFEANMQWAIGVEEERPFRVDVLENPLRLVVDVGH